MTRLGASILAIGVALDVPPHVLPHASLETLALAGHLVVLAGMAIVLLGLALVATSFPSPKPRRPT
ncbi:MAG TPA: hypothetical protein VF230_10170 [Acidimicrobiales bacterium]